MALVAELRKLMQTSSGLDKNWYRVDTELWADGRRLGQMVNPELAEYLIRLHNIFLPFANAMVRLEAKQQDKRKVAAGE